jgi:hypothetical protein
MAFMHAPASAGSGDFVPILAYKANQGRLYTRDRTQDLNGQWNAVETEVTKQQPAYAVDFGRLETGWCHFVAGAAPIWNMVPYGQPLPPKPASPGKDDAGKDLNFRQGFRVPVAGNAIGGVRELAGNSAALINGMNELHSAYEAAPEAAMGQIPIVKMTDTLPIKTGQSTNFQPVFTIVGWADRPEVLGPRTVPPPRASTPISQMQPAQVAEMAAASVPQAKAPDEMPF